jgi:ATP-dependent DNA ligase
MKKQILYQLSTTGKIKVHEFWTAGSKFYSRWGQLNGKMQETFKECVGMNIGKANETSPAEQAIAEMESKIVIKKKEGYDEKLPKPSKKVVSKKIDLDNIPEEFCPNKPISKTPKGILEGTDTYGQRKFDGHCLFLVKGKFTEKVYSRRMEDKTDCLIDVPVINALMQKIPKGTFLMTEFTYYDNKTKREAPRHVARITRAEDPIKVSERYVELEQCGTFDCIPFDVMFFDYEFIGNQDYVRRIENLTKLKLPIPTIYPNWRDMLTYAEDSNWEGFVLRVPGERSHIAFTMDGNAHRAGSYKYKFLKTDDFFVTEWEKGKSGKHAAFYAKFAVAQYDDESGKIIDRGYVGPGKLTHEELEQLTKDIDYGIIQKNFVVEAEYQDIQDSGKLQFGIIQRLRPDKTHKECIAE